MATPRRYSRTTSFSGYQATNPNRPLPGPALDNELAGIETAVNEAIAALGDIRRDDGFLRNGIVTRDALSPDLATGVTPATLWEAGLVYQAQDTVSVGAAFYRCTIGHTSNVDFLVDLNAARWVLYADIGTLATGVDVARDEAVAAAAVAVPAASTASAAAVTASAAAASAVANYDLFDDRYLGEKTSLPTLDNDGNALVNGALVSLTGQTPETLNGMYIRRGGAWGPVVGVSAGLFQAYRYVATASQTVFSGVDANGLTLAYTVGSIIVTVNGVTQTPNTYAASNGTSVVFGAGLTASDVVMVHSFGSFVAADAWTKAEADSRYATPAVQYRVRNVNHAFQHSQERGTTLVDVTTGTAYVVDQLRAVLSTTPGGTLRGQHTAGFTPGGSPFFVRFTVQASDASLAAGDYYGFDMPVEGNMIADARMGTASASATIKRVAFRSSIAGTFHFYVQNSARNRSRPMPFTIGAGEVNTWVTRTFAIPGDTSGTWLTDNGLGMICGVTLASGTTFNGTANTWQVGDARSVAGATNFMATGSATFDVADAGLYVDPLNIGAPPPWEIPDFGDELSRCQRYWRLTRVAVQSSFTVTLQHQPQIRAVPVVSGGGAGFSLSWNFLNSAGVIQTTAAVQDLVFNARF
jgi:hypothetical protein